MPGQAQITSVEALEAFRSDLIVFLTQMQPVLDEVGGELVRMKYWLQNDHRQTWESQARQHSNQPAGRGASRAFPTRQTLTFAGVFQPATQLVTQRAQKAVHESEQKLTALKKWDRELENQAEPLVKQVEQLQSFLANDMRRAVTYLTQIIQTLEAYTDVLPSGPGTDSIPPADGSKATS